jgi:nitroimidazol reductase NimA-like FMN-containing flavoprotein (pyridoxamine 5'-phosphate oxidase superfamily)
MRDLTTDEIQDLLRTERVGHVAVLDGETPYVSPLSFVYTDDIIVFRTMEGRRLAAIRDHPRVSMEVTRTGPGAADWQSVLVIGDASIIDDRSVSSRYVGLIVAKYRAAYGVHDHLPDWILDPDAYVVQIDPIEISGRAAGETRPGRIDAPRRD